jgi:hypothetical protein
MRAFLARDIVYLAVCNSRGYEALARSKSSNVARLTCLLPAEALDALRGSHAGQMAGAELESRYGASKLNVRASM